MIEKNPRFYMYFTAMFDEIPEKKPYKFDPTGHKQIRDYEHMLQVLNHILETAPTWTSNAGKSLKTSSVSIDRVQWSRRFLGSRGERHAQEGSEHLGKVLDGQSPRRVDRSLLTYSQSPESAKVLNRGKHGWFGETAVADIQTVGNKPKSTNAKFEEMFLSDPKKEHYGFTSWDDFFTRKLAPGWRETEAPEDDSIIANACESKTFNVQYDCQLRDKFWNKGNKYSIRDMLGHDELAEQFAGGTVYQAFLSALSYHRWHAPVSGTIKKAFLVDGTYFSEPLARTWAATRPGPSTSLVSPRARATSSTWQLDEVSTCDITVKEGQHVKKGEETGMFHFGGSSHCLIFRKDCQVGGFPEPGQQVNVPDSTDTATVNPFSRRESFSPRSLGGYRFLTLLSWLLVVVFAVYYTLAAPQDGNHGRHHEHNRRIFSQNDANPTPFKLNSVLVIIYWITLFVSQLGYVQRLFSNDTANVTAAANVGSHFIFHNLLAFAFIMLWTRGRFWIGELVLIIDFINLTSLYFRHPKNHSFVHFPAIAGPLAWTYVAILWDGAAMVHAHSLPARILANIAIWGILGYGWFFLAIYKDYYMGFSLAFLSAAWSWPLLECFLRMWSAMSRRRRNLSREAKDSLSLATETGKECYFVVSYRRQACTRMLEDSECSRVRASTQTAHTFAIHVTLYTLRDNDPCQAAAASIRLRRSAESMRRTAQENGPTRIAAVHSERKADSSRGRCSWSCAVPCLLSAATDRNAHSSPHEGVCASAHGRCHQSCTRRLEAMLQTHDAVE
ncbi:hypothetical protein MRB53_040621 [Persea americana]|nr:hypothetical protein MRB53_040621 [Persea americana]